MKGFGRARPITKASPIFKILDGIMNERLRKEIDRMGKKGLCAS